MVHLMIDYDCHHKLKQAKKVPLLIQLLYQQLAILKHELLIFLD